MALSAAEGGAKRRPDRLRRREAPSVGDGAKRRPLDTARSAVRRALRARRTTVRASENTRLKSTERQNHKLTGFVCAKHGPILCFCMLWLVRCICPRIWRPAAAQLGHLGSIWVFPGWRFGAGFSFSTSRPP